MSFNDEIRAAAGYGRAEHDEASERVEGSIGIGRGGASSPPRPRETTREINEAIRTAASHVRGRIEDDDLWENH